MRIDLVVLVGGLGTRLRSVTGEDIPKPMAMIYDKPFLYYLLSHMINQNPDIDKIILAAGYKNSVISQYFGDKFQGKRVIYSIEDHPLGTGGAIRKAIGFSNKEESMVINGDGLSFIDFQKFTEDFQKNKSDIQIATYEIKKYDKRFDYLFTNINGKLESIGNMSPTDGPLYLNRGIYLLKSSVFDHSPNDKFSFEKVTLRDNKLNIYTSNLSGEFFDIGIPRDFKKSKKLIKDKFIDLKN